MGGPKWLLCVMIKTVTSYIIGRWMLTRKRKSKNNCILEMKNDGVGPIYTCSLQRPGVPSVWLQLLLLPHTKCLIQICSLTFLLSVFLLSLLAFLSVFPGDFILLLWRYISGIHKQWKSQGFCSGCSFCCTLASKIILSEISVYYLNLCSLPVAFL